MTLDIKEVLLDIFFSVGYNYLWNVLGTGILGAFFSTPHLSVGAEGQL